MAIVIISSKYIFLMNIAMGVQFTFLTPASFSSSSSIFYFIEYKYIPMAASVIMYIVQALQYVWIT